MQSGALTPSHWKKKVEQTFKSNKYHRSLCIIESLTSGIYKSKLLDQILKSLEWESLILGDLENLKEALIQIDELKRAKREKEQILLSDPDVDVEELVQRHREMQKAMIREKDWKFASYNIPLEVHIQLIKFCYDYQKWDLFNNLLSSALVRLKYRRYEVPYLSTIDVLMSTLKEAAIPDSFEKLPTDLNSANLRIELKKIRKRKYMEDEIEAGRGSPPKKLEKDESLEINERLATDEELDEIKHIFVNVLLQRSKNPKNAIVEVDVAMINEDDDSAIPDGYFAVAIPIRQHEGVYEKYHKIPYILFKRTKNNLRDEEELLSLVTDIVVITGKSPDIQAPLCYHKIPVDLRQNPVDLIEATNLDYVYI